MEGLRPRLQGVLCLFTQEVRMQSGGRCSVPSSPEHLPSQLTDCDQALGGQNQGVGPVKSVSWETEGGKCHERSTGPEL